MTRTFRTLASLAVASLVLGALVAAPAGAKAKKCAKYRTPDWAAGAATSIVTDKATADAPIEIELATEPGLGLTDPSYPGNETIPAITHVFQNVVVDTAAKSASLWASIEFPPAFDYDLYVRDPFGLGIAYEADFNPATAAGPTPIDPGAGGHAEPGLSQIDGLPGFDCVGYTIDVASATTPGGAVILKIWLGK